MPDDRPNFDQLPPDVQEDVLDLIALVLLNQALAELDADASDLTAPARKAG